MTQTKTLLLIFATMMLMCVPTNAFTPADTVMLFHVSDYGVDIGSGTGYSNLGVVDGTPDTFIEAKHISTRAELIAPIYAEDDLDKWNISGDMSNLVVNGTAFDGSYSIKATLAGSGTGEMKYQNGTAFAWGLDATYADLINFSMRCSATKKVVLTQIRTHKTADDYGYINTEVYLLSTWQAISYSVAEVQFHGDVQIGDPINWLEWDYTNEGGVARNVFMDAGMLYGHPAGTVLRDLHAWFNFTNIPDYDHYEVNVTAWRFSLDNPTNDAVFTENATLWNSNSTSMTISEDASNAQVGTNAIQFDFKANASASVWWANGTAKSASFNLSMYLGIYFMLWGNRSFNLCGFRLCTDANNYYSVDFRTTYGTTPTAYFIPFGIMNQTGSPDLSNANWMEVCVNSSAVTNPTRIWLDDMWFTTYEAARFRNDGSDYFDVYHSQDYVSDVITLNATEVQDDGFIIVRLNDTFSANDPFNTTVLIDALFVVAWNDGGGGGPAEPASPVPTKTEITPEAWVIPAQYYWLIGLGAAGIIGVVVVAKVGMYRLDDTFGGCLQAISDSIMDAYDKLREVFG